MNRVNIPTCSFVQLILLVAVPKTLLGLTTIDAATIGFITQATSCMSNILATTQLRVYNKIKQVLITCQIPLNQLYLITGSSSPLIDGEHGFMIDLSKYAPLARPEMYDNYSRYF